MASCLDAASTVPPAGLYREQLGGGHDLVLLHGWAMHSGVWETVARSLSDRHRVTLVDLPGHGYSREVACEPSLEAISRRVAAAAPERAVWLGWSLGGLVAQWIAAHCPRRVAKLVLVASSPCFARRDGWPHALSGHLLRQFAAGLREDYRATLQRFLALEVHGSEQATEQLRGLRRLMFARGDPAPAMLQEGLAILENTDLRPVLDAVTCPSLLLLGGRDKLVPVAAGEATRALLHQAHVRVIARAGHAPFMSHVHEFVDHLRPFLDD